MASQAVMTDDPIPARQGISDQLSKEVYMSGDLVTIIILLMMTILCVGGDLWLGATILRVA